MFLFPGVTGSASTAHFPAYAPSASNSVVPPGGPALPVTGRGTTLVSVCTGLHPAYAFVLGGFNSLCVSG